MPPPNATQRFSDRVADYVRSRPGYPAAVLDALREAGALAPGAVVVDVGSGTGISSALFLEAGHRVVGVEPNAEMRAAAERILAGHAGFRSVDGTAEATTLPDACADLVVAGQAFHWFDAGRARAEWARILGPGGQAALLWNVRRTEATPFLRDYEALLQRFGTDYRAVRHENVGPEALAAFFAGDYRTWTFENVQTFDRDGVRGRLLSSSYTPPPGHPDHGPMLRELDRIVDRHGGGGPVRIEYDTVLHLGAVS